jgi:hypothetical protein
MEVHVQTQQLYSILEFLSDIRPDVPQMSQLQAAAS